MLRIDLMYSRIVATPISWSMFHLNPIPIDGPDLGNKRPETADGLELQLNARTTEFREAFDAGNQLAERRLFECGTLH